ncbi:MAG: hypothetical protein B7C24_02940 [Bacteroidetes bacterium 4572_77]|nr:MAG: hypothetical protein B7C24_02940 [Bacteroidetes bacterium 4572_77]
MKNYLFFLFLTISLSLLAQHQFHNVTSQQGISGLSGLGHAVGWGDINNDGLQDVAFSNQDGSGFWLYKNNGENFQNITASAGLSGNSGNMILFADINNNGWEDLILYPQSGNQKIFINNTDETFSLMSNSGVNKMIRVVADFNKDGYIDLMSTSNDQLTIFYNQEGETFTNEVVGSFSSNFSAIILDYNNDSWPDIYLGTYSDAPNALFKNNGDGTFENVANEAGVLFPYAAHGLTTADYNNDGWADIYIGSYSGSTTSKLFLNNTDGSFSDVTNNMNAQGHQDTRTVSSVDYNNNGWMDLFASHHNFYSYSNTLQRNNYGDDFTELAHEMGISGDDNNWMGDYFGLGWADYDNDGDMDLFAAGHIDKYVLWENRNCPGHFMELILQGVQSNQNAVGAAATIWQNGALQKRWIQVGSGQHDSHSKRLHFGLGENDIVDSLIIDWPSGIQHRFQNTQIVVDEIWTIEEDINMSTRKTPESLPISLRINPVNNFLLFNSSSKEKADLKIYNYQSQLIWSKQSVYLYEKIALPPTLPTGNYLINITNSKQQKTLKLFKL